MADILLGFGHGSQCIFVRLHELHMCAKFHNCRLHVLANVNALWSHYGTVMCNSPKTSNGLPVQICVLILVSF